MLQFVIKGNIVKKNINVLESAPSICQLKVNSLKIGRWSWHQKWWTWIKAENTLPPCWTPVDK